jgi:replicative DNA helicase
MSDSLSLLLSDLRVWYSANPTLDAPDKDGFKWWLWNIRHSNLNADKQAAVNALIEDAYTLSNPDPIVLTHYMQRAYGEQIAEAALDVATGGNTDMDAVAQLVSQWRTEHSNINGFVDAEKFGTLETLKDSLVNINDGHRFTWPINELDMMLGTITQGDFIILGARPDMGKTTLMAACCAHWVSEVEDGRTILWCNNEESLWKVQLKQLQALLGWTVEECTADIDVTYAKAEAAGFDKIKTYDNTSMSIEDIDAAIEMYKPQVIIIDQVWKVAGFETKQRNDITRYAELAKYVRGLAKDNGPVIGASQIGPPPAGQEKFPDMSCLYNSKTAVQGEADAIIMLGSDPDSGDPGQRFIHAPKNKMPFAHPQRRKAGISFRADWERAQLIGSPEIAKEYAKWKS